MGEMVMVAEVGDLEPGEAMCVDVQGEPIALFNADGVYYAIHDTCPHAGGPLSEGELLGTVITCPWHMAQFDLATGQILDGPASEGVFCYKVVVDGDSIYVDLE